MATHADIVYEKTTANHGAKGLFSLHYETWGQRSNNQISESFCVVVQSKAFGPLMLET